LSGDIFNGLAQGGVTEVTAPSAELPLRVPKALA